MTKVTTHKGIDIYVREDGLFVAERDGHKYSATMLAEIKLIVDRAARAKKIRVSVPFYCPQRMKHGVVTGRHATRGTYLVHWSDGERDELNTLYGLLRPLVAEEAEELRKLSEAKVLADRAYQQFIAARRETGLSYKVDAEIKERHKQAEATGIEPEEPAK